MKSKLTNNMKTLEEIKKFTYWLYEESCRDDVNFLDNKHRFYVEKKLKRLIDTTILQTKQELIEEAINSLTGDIRKYKFINDGLKKWRLSEDREDRGIEPCDECGNGGMIRDFLEKLSNK